MILWSYVNVAELAEVSFGVVTFSFYFIFSEAGKRLVGRVRGILTSKSELEGVEFDTIVGNMKVLQLAFFGKFSHI